MNIRRVAKEVIDRYGQDIYEILNRLNIKIVQVDLPGRLPEVFFGDYIALKKGLSENERIYYLSHALGHYFLHKEGNYLLFF